MPRRPAFSYVLAAPRLAALALLLLFALAWPVMAHEGHDHGAAPETIAAAQRRAEAHSDLFEVVAILQPGRALAITFDRYAEPICPTDLAAILRTQASDAADQGHDVAYEGPGRAVLSRPPLAAKRAVSNPVENALRHGRPPVRLRIRDEGADVAIEVADAGDRIAEAERARALAPFTQMDAARGGAGAGLALAIAQRFAEASEGRLELRTAPEGGLWARLLQPRQEA